MRMAPCGTSWTTESRGVQAHSEHKRHSLPELHVADILLPLNVQLRWVRSLRNRHRQSNGRVTGQSNLAVSWSVA